jgi:hypothetical protein
MEKDKTRYLRPSAYSERTSIPESTLAKMRMRGDGPPYIKVGTSVLYDTAKDDEWFASRRRNSTSDPGEAA